MFYLHPWEIDPDQPRVEASLVSRFRHYQNLARTESRLRQLLAEFAFGPAISMLATADGPAARAGVEPAPAVA
jgi:hypothetical protein